MNSNTSSVSSMSDIPILTFAVVCINSSSDAVILIVGLTGLAFETRANLSSDSCSITDFELGHFGSDSNNFSSDLVPKSRSLMAVRHMMIAERPTSWPAIRGKISGSPHPPVRVCTSNTIDTASQNDVIWRQKAEPERTHHSSKHHRN